MSLEMFVNCLCCIFFSALFCRYSLLFIHSTCAECANSHTKCAESHTFCSLKKCYIVDNQYFVFSDTVFVGKIIESCLF